MNNNAFISYRRDVSAFMTRAIFQDLWASGYDLFLDVESIDSDQSVRHNFAQPDRSAPLLTK
jgi:hypothetical protein